MGQSTDAFSRQSVTFATGQSVSGQANLTSLQVLGVGLIVPATWTAADIGFEVSNDNGVTWIPVCDAEGALVKITGISTSVKRVYIAPAEAWVIGAFPLLRLTSLNTSTGEALNQSGAKEVTVVRLSS